MYRLKQSALFFISIACATLSGCSLLAPGMSMDTSALKHGERSDGNLFRAPQETAEQMIEPMLIPVTPQLIRKLVSEASVDTPIPNELVEVRPEDYKIAEGDIIAITVWDHPELTIPAGEFRTTEAGGHLVSTGGTIFYPYVGVVLIAGKTAAEVRDLLTKKLRTYIQNPQIDVRVAAYRGKKVLITGEVQKPAAIPLNDRPMTLLEAINSAGGASGEADLRNVLLTRRGKVYPIDVLALYRKGKGHDVFVTDQDQIHVSDRSENKVYVLGEVMKPSYLVMKNRRMTLTEAIGSASGVNEGQADAKQIYVIRGSAQKPVIYNLDARSADAMILATSFPLEPQDVVYVAPTVLTRWNRVLNQIIPTIQALKN